MVNVDEWIPEWIELKGEGRKKAMEEKIASVSQKGDLSLAKLTEVLNRAGFCLQVREKTLKREGVLLYLNVKGELEAKNFSVLFDPDNEFADVYFYGQDEAKLIPCFVEWLGCSPHHRYRSRDLSSGEHRAYCFDKDSKRAEFVLQEDTQKRADVYGIERLH